MEDCSTPEFQHKYAKEFMGEWANLADFSVLTSEDLDDILIDRSKKEIVWEWIKQLEQHADNISEDTDALKWQNRFPKRKYGYLELEKCWELLVGKDQDICKYKPDKEIGIAIIDTGVKRKHHAFTQGDSSKSNVLEGASFPQRTKGKEWKDKKGHGTMCASIAAGKRFEGELESEETEESKIEDVIGVAPFSNIIPLQITLDAEEQIVDNIVNAIEWAIEKREEKQIDIISISIGLPKCTGRLKNVINDATSEGIIVVACASNEGDENQYNIKYPGRFGNVICVGAHGQSGRAAFSSTGREVDFLAPGEGIYGASSKGKHNAVTRDGGTSFATPFAAGVCALVLAFAEKCGGSTLRSRISHTQIMKQILYRMTTSPGYHNEHTGYGNIQPWNLFKYGEDGFKSVVTSLQESVEGCQAVGMKENPHTTLPSNLLEAVDVCRTQTNVKSPIANSLVLTEFGGYFQKELEPFLADVNRIFVGFYYYLRSNYDYPRQLIQDTPQENPSIKWIGKNPFQIVALLNEVFYKFSEYQNEHSDLPSFVQFSSNPHNLRLERCCIYPEKNYFLIFHVDAVAYVWIAELTEVFYRSYFSTFQSHFVIRCENEVTVDNLNMLLKSLSSYDPYVIFQCRSLKGTESDWKTFHDIPLVKTNHVILEKIEEIWGDGFAYDSESQLSQEEDAVRKWIQEAQQWHDKFKAILFPLQNRCSMATQGMIKQVGEKVLVSNKLHSLHPPTFAFSELADALTHIAVMRYVLQQASTQSGHHEQDTGHGTIYLTDLLSDPEGHRLKVLVDEISLDYTYHK